MKRNLILLLLVLTGISTHAQDSQLKEIVQSVVSLRKANKTVRNKAVLDLSATGKPKITLMDELKSSESEYRGKNAHQFKANQVVTYIYGRQNTLMVSKGDYFNSTEKDIFYSAIEKNLKRGEEAIYTLNSHVGAQEFMFVPFNPKTKFKATVNDTEATPMGDGILYVKLKPVTKSQSINITILVDAKNSAAYESIVILNHNPQK